MVVITHDLFAWMRWGDEHSAGHYLDLVSAVLGGTLFPVGYLLHALTPYLGQTDKQEQSGPNGGLPAHAQARRRWASTPRFRLPSGSLLQHRERVSVLRLVGSRCRVLIDR